jgi:ubiquinone/menaquinone biosynthesis C-methylase UbiE
MRLLKPAFLVTCLATACLLNLGSILYAQAPAVKAAPARIDDPSATAELDANNPADASKRAENLPQGINDSFLDPNMNVEDFIQRFEVESREVFAARMAILKEVQLEPGMSIADIGTGTGLYVAPFSRAVGSQGKVYAVDISPKFVKHIRQRADEEQLDNVEAVLCSDRDVNLKANSIDRAFICDVYHHFEYPESSLASIHRAMRDGGKLILIDFHREPDVSPERVEWLTGHIRAPMETFKQEIIDAGFEFEGEVAIDGFKENYMLRFIKTGKGTTAAPSIQ